MLIYLFIRLYTSGDKTLFHFSSFKIPVTMRFLHPSSRGRTLASGFCSELLPRCFTTGRFAGSLLCTSHGIETSLLTPLLLRLELGELEAALALERDGGAAAAANTVIPF